VQIAACNAQFESSPKNRYYIDIFSRATMTITYHSEGCFRIQTGDLSLVVDPTSERFKADITLRTLTSSSEDPMLHKDPHELSSAGEYDIKGVRINGFQVPGVDKDRKIKTIYTVEWEEMRLGFLGHLSNMLEPEAFEQLGDVDILFVPLGSPYLSGEIAAKIVKQVEPHIVIPGFAQNPKDLLKELGQSADPVQKLTLKKKELGEGMRVVWIKE
jgi:L-ascorbate metabolism protein UlaG (beta-lactamase superfamily)